MDGLGHEPCKSLTNHPKRRLIGRVASSRFLFHQATTFDGKTTVNEFKHLKICCPRDTVCIEFLPSTVFLNDP